MTTRVANITRPCIETTILNARCTPEDHPAWQLVREQAVELLDSIKASIDAVIPDLDEEIKRVGYDLFLFDANTYHSLQSPERVPLLHSYLDLLWEGQELDDLRALCVKGLSGQRSEIVS